MPAFTIGMAQQQYSLAFMVVGCQVSCAPSLLFFRQSAKREHLVTQRHTSVTPQFRLFPPPWPVYPSLLSWPSHSPVSPLLSRRPHRRLLHPVTFIRRPVGATPTVVRRFWTRKMQPVELNGVMQGSLRTLSISSPSRFHLTHPSPARS